jgi:hypothetical protein
VLDLEGSSEINVLERDLGLRLLWLLHASARSIALLLLSSRGRGRQDLLAETCVPSL